VSISSFGDEFDEYEGQPLDPWTPPSTTAPGWPDDELWDDPEYESELETLLEHAEDLAWSLTLNRVTEIDEDRLDAIAHTSADFVDKDQTRSEFDEPYRSIIVNIDRTDHVYVVNRVDDDSSTSVQWAVQALDELDSQLTEERTPEPSSTPVVISDVVERSGFTIRPIAHRTEQVRTLSGSEQTAEVALYRYHDEMGNTVDFGLFRAENGEAWLHTFHVDSELPSLGRLRHGGRMGVRIDGPTATAELTHLRISNYPWSGLRMASAEELASSAGRDVVADLVECGALEIGTRAELEGNTSGRRNILAVRFRSEEDAVPVQAYALTRIVTLVHAERETSVRLGGIDANQEEG